jgi:hypothetical protein
VAEFPQGMELAGLGVKRPDHGVGRGVTQLAWVLVCGLGGACVKFYLVLKGAQRKATADRAEPGFDNHIAFPPMRT